MKRNKAKHLKSKRKFKLTSRFYALITLIFGVITIPIISTINNGDITANIFITILGLFGYIVFFFFKEVKNMETNLALDCKEFDEYLIDTYQDCIMDYPGIHYIFRFNNGLDGKNKYLKLLEIDKNYRIISKDDILNSETTILNLSCLIIKQEK